MQNGKSKLILNLFNLTVNANVGGMVKNNINSLAFLISKHLRHLGIGKMCSLFICANELKKLTERNLSYNTAVNNAVVKACGRSCVVSATVKSTVSKNRNLESVPFVEHSVKIYLAVEHRSAEQGDLLCNSGCICKLAGNKYASSVKSRLLCNFAVKANVYKVDSVFVVISQDVDFSCFTVELSINVKERFNVLKVLNKVIPRTHGNNAKLGVFKAHHTCGNFLYRTVATACIKSNGCICSLTNLFNKFSCFTNFFSNVNLIRNLAAVANLVNIVNKSMEFCSLTRCWVHNKIMFHFLPHN